MQIKDYNGKELNIGDKCLVATCEKQGVGKKYKLVELYIARITAATIFLQEDITTPHWSTDVKVSISWSSDCIIKL